MEGTSTAHHAQIQPTRRGPMNWFFLFHESCGQGPEPPPCPPLAPAACPPIPFHPNKRAHPSGVSAGGVRARAVAAGGAVVGGVSHARGQCGGAEEGEAFAAVRRGWCLGGEEFRRELLAQVDRQLGALHFGTERAESQEARAERQVQAELKRLGWTEMDLAARRKGDPAKVRLAQRLREETLVTLGWIALSGCKWGVWRI